jgi:hypothetical protein
MSPPGPSFIAIRRNFASRLMSRGSDFRLAPPISAPCRVVPSAREVAPTLHVAVKGLWRLMSPAAECQPATPRGTGVTRPRSAVWTSGFRQETGRPEPGESASVGAAYPGVESFVVRLPLDVQIRDLVLVIANELLQENIHLLNNCVSPKQPRRRHEQPASASGTRVKPDWVYALREGPVRADC